LSIDNCDLCDEFLLKKYDKKHRDKDGYFILTKLIKKTKLNRDKYKYLDLVFLDKTKENNIA